MTFFGKRRRTFGWLAILGLYAIVAVVTPLLHHDVACHLQSKSHCDACTVSSAASSIESGIVHVGHAGLIERHAANDVHARTSADRPSSPGRAPPQESSVV